MFNCCHCNIELIINETWSAYNRCRNTPVCLVCMKKAKQEQKKIKQQNRTPEQIEQDKVKSKAYYQRNKEKAKTYYENNKPKLQEYSRSYRQQYTLLKNYKAKVQVLNLLGGCKCCICGETDIRTLQVNHIKGRSKDEPKGAEFYTTILKGLRSTEDLDVRCANCNLLYEYERGNKQFPAGAALHPYKKYEPFTFC